MSTWTNSWSDPVQRAAVWYLAAFAALASVLLTGTQLSGFVWGRATHPVWAAALVGLSVAAAAGVVGLAAKVLTPTYELTDLKRRQQRAEEAIEGDDSSWRAIAAQDSRVLEPLYAIDGFEGDNDSPIQLGRLAPEGPAQAQRANEMVAAANRRAAAGYFRTLRVGAPFALGLVLATALAWPTLSQTERQVASAENPVPVQLVLRPGVQPGSAIGGECSLTTLQGVAISGDVRSTTLIALPPQDDCPGKLLLVDPSIVSVSRT